MPDFTSRRSFLQAVGLGAALGAHQLAQAADKPIQGFEKATNTRMRPRGGHLSPIARSASESSATECAVSALHSVSRTIRTSRLSPSAT